MAEQLRSHCYCKQHFNFKNDYRNQKTFNRNSDVMRLLPALCSFKNSAILLHNLKSARREWIRYVFKNQEI